MTDYVNICDIIIVGILFVFMVGAYRRGLIRSVFGLIGTVASIILAGQAYPYITRFLRETGIVYGMINEAIQTWLRSSSGVGETGQGVVETVVSGSLKTQVDLINGLPLPGFMKDSLVSGNNSVIYQALNVDGIYDYIAGFLTNICINIIGWVLAFFVISILLKLLVSALDLIAKLPVISTFNKLGGLVVGFIQATLFIWVCHVVIVLFFSSSNFAVVNEMMGKSMFAGLFFEYNLILEMINKFVM